MKIEFGKLFRNRTLEFLVPVLRKHGQDFISKFNYYCFKLAYGIEDRNFKNKALLKDRRPIFILIDKDNNIELSNSFLDWIRKQDYYITDYSKKESSSLHMIVLDTPLDYYDSYDKFMLGMYSKMYSKQDIEEIFRDKNSKGYRVIVKDRGYLDTFLNQLKEEFDFVPQIEDRQEYIEETELDFPYSLSVEDEIFT